MCFFFYLLVITGYLADTSGYLVVTSGYLIATTGYFSLLLVTSRYFWFLVLVTTNENYFKKIHHRLLDNQSIQFSSSSRINNILQEREVIFKKNPTVGSPEVSKMIDSAISKRRGKQRKHRFRENKILHKRKNGFIMNTQKYHIMDGSCYEAIDSSISQNIFSYLKMFSMQCRKTLQLKITKKE